MRGEQQAQQGHREPPKSGRLHHDFLRAINQLLLRRFDAAYITRAVPQPNKKLPDPPG
jgi:hypothetical protein